MYLESVVHKKEETERQHEFTVHYWMWWIRNSWTGG